MSWNRGYKFSITFGTKGFVGILRFINQVLVVCIHSIAQKSSCNTSQRCLCITEDNESMIERVYQCVNFILSGKLSELYRNNSRASSVQKIIRIEIFISLFLHQYRLFFARSSHLRLFLHLFVFDVVLLFYDLRSNDIL